MKELEWGETPWDNFSREDLLREVQRMYSAVLSAHSVMILSREPSSLFWWSDDGSGRRALAKTQMVLDKVKELGYKDENIYRSFFRYAIDLLFTPELGFGWAVCDTCDSMIGSGVDTKDMVGEECPFCKNNGKLSLMRKLEWKDLAKKE